MRTDLDRPLVLTLLALAAYGLAMVYSAGQTDLPTAADRAWVRQLVWMVLAIAMGAVAFRLSFRILEWAAPVLYGLGLALLALTLVVGTGAGTASEIGRAHV